MLPRDTLNNDNGAKHTLYYAVRIGYATAADHEKITLDDSEETEVDSDSEDCANNQPIKKRRRIDEESVCNKENLSNPTNNDNIIKTKESNNPTVKIRSAIFLYWEDVRQFVQHTSSQSPAYKVEYAAFDTFQEAE